MDHAADELPMTEYNEKKRVLTSQNSGPVITDEGEGGKPAVRDLLVYYARHSTMHGIPSIVGSRLYRGRRIFWCIVVCVMALLLVTVIYWQMSDFYRYPTVTSVNVKYATEGDFPSVTICELNTFNKNFIEDLDVRVQMQMTYLTEITGIFHLVGKDVLNSLLQNFTQPSDYNISKSDEEIVENLIQRVKKMIEDGSGGLFCAWGDFYWDSCNVSMRTRVTDLGVCFTIDTRKLVKNITDDSGKGTDINPVGNAIRGLSLVVATATEDIPFRLYHSEGYKVVLHDHDEDPLPQSRGFLIGLNRSVEVEIAKSVMNHVYRNIKLGDAGDVGAPPPFFETDDMYQRTGLEPPFKAFGTGTCVNVESPSFVNPLKRYSYYTKEACEAECFVNYVIKLCDCRHFLHPGNETLCPLEKLKDCFRDAEAKYYGGRSARDDCDCPMPCKQSVFKASVSYANFRTTHMFETHPVLRNISDGVTSLHLFFPDPVVTIIEQVPVYSLEGLLGSIGGQVGLFMGFSLVTVAEMCELIFLLCTRGRRLFGDDPRRAFAHSNNRAH